MSRRWKRDEPRHFFPPNLNSEVASSRTATDVLQSFDPFVQRLRIAKIVAQLSGSEVDLAIVDKRENLPHNFPIASAARGENEAGTPAAYLAAVVIPYSATARSVRTALVSTRSRSEILTAQAGN